MTLYYSFLEHPFTRLMLISSEIGLRSVQFIPQDIPLPNPQSYYPGDTLLDAGHRHDAVSQQLRLYLDGTPVIFDEKFDLVGTPFQKSVWAAIARIPFGHTMTYGEIAAALGNPNGSRAVGGATGKNPLSIIIP